MLIKEVHYTQQTLSFNDCVSISKAGSKDGCIKVWKVKQDYKGIEFKFQIRVEGFINALQFNEDATLLVAGVGQEHKYGRWWRIKGAKNSVVVVPLTKSN